MFDFTHRFEALFERNILHGIEEMICKKKILNKRKSII